MKVVTGSGFIFDKNGNIVTNYHVVDNATSIYVRFNSGNSYTSKILGADPYSDLAVLQVDSSALFSESIKPIPIANLSSVRVGDSVFAIGNPGSSLGIEFPKP